MAAEKTLRQRINLIQADVKQPKATGKDQYSHASLSIDDVEEALQPLLAKHGVVIRHGFLEIPAWMPDANPPAWLVHLGITVENSDNPADFFVDSSYDTGSNISAAVSYALKRYEKGLFKIGGEEEGQGAQSGGSRQTGVATGATSASNGSGAPCPGCDKTDFVRKGANRSTGAPEWYCYKKLGGCGKTWPVDSATVAIAPRQTSLVDDEPPPPESPY